MLDDFDGIRLRDLKLFDRLVGLGSITAAAEALGVPKATASRWLAQLEERVGQPLVHRTTRHMALTQHGEVFHRQVRALLQVAQATRAATQADAPAGTLRASVPVPLGRLIGGRVIAGFCEALPRVRLEVLLRTRRVNLVRDGLDLSIHAGPLPDSDLLARRLALVPVRLYASARYRDADPCQVPLLATRGDVALLSAHRPALRTPSVLIDDRAAIADAVSAGAGMGMLPAFLGEPRRALGELVRVDETPLTAIPVHAVSLASARADVRLSVLIAQIQAALNATLAA
ncbi:MAG: LysR family transcriptional regulator [Alphaproteobacteria bacterium]|nr:LysR family transcriptional regulator [Alphaproteobacteria bacterium]